MSDTPQPTSGSLSAKLIRACPTHKTCALDCKYRQVEDLGELARFAAAEEDPSPKPWLERVLERITPRKDT
jgi:hypothetical protein